MARIDAVGGILIRAEDPPAMARFYRDVLGLPLHTEHDGGYFGELQTPAGPLHLAVVPWIVDGAPLFPARVAVSFHVDAFEPFLQRLEDANVELEQVIEDEMGSYAYFRDPEANQVSVWCEAAPPQAPPRE